MFGIFLKHLSKNLIKHPFLTLFTSLFILLNFFFEKFKCKKIFNFLNKIKIKVKVDGNVIRFRIPDFIIISDVFLVEEYNALNPSENSIIFDIGASIGAYSLKISKNNSQIIAIEPSPENFKYLKENLEENKIKNISAINIALSDINGYSDFFIDKTNGGASSFFRQGGNYKKIKVKTVRLDDLIKTLDLDIRKKIFIKIDVEGAELNILRGATKLLRNKNIKILMETHPWIIDPMKLKEFLELYNFEVKILDLNLPFILAQKF